MRSPGPFIYKKPVTPKPKGKETESGVFLNVRNLTKIAKIKKLLIKKLLAGPKQKVENVKDNWRIANQKLSFS